MAASQEKLLAVDGIGEQTAAAVRDYFINPENCELIAQLLELGLTVQAAKKKAASDNGPLHGMVFLFTGTISGMTRSEAEQQIKALGGEAVSSISKKVTHLVAGEKAGSKLKKAVELGIQIMDEPTFLRLLKQ